MQRALPYRMRRSRKRFRRWPIITECRLDSMKTLITDNERKSISTDLRIKKAVDIIIENSKEDKTKKTAKAEDGDDLIEKKIPKRKKENS